jgi:non-canonical purine NTP pyrophosphatase (RdgB/HAM1 family)
VNSNQVMLYFITGNKSKFEEVKLILREVEQLDIDLPEIQDIDPKNIIRAKLMEALNHSDGEFLVEDTSLYLDCINGLPGPLIKWFLKGIGNEGLVKITQLFGNDKAEAKTLIGYAKSKDDMYFFEGVIKGKIVPGRGALGFGWDSIFLPEGHAKTFAEMSLEEKSGVSMRKLATQKLLEFIANSHA